MTDFERRNLLIDINWLSSQYTGNQINQNSILENVSTAGLRIILLRLQRIVAIKAESDLLARTASEQWLVLNDLSDSYKIRR